MTTFIAENIFTTDGIMKQIITKRKEKQLIKDWSVLSIADLNIVFFFFLFIILIFMYFNLVCVYVAYFTCPTTVTTFYFQFT